MLIKTFPVGAFQCNCTILIDEKTCEAIVVDPGDEAERILAELKKQQCALKYLIHTHAHIDHVMATRTVKEKGGGQICLHKDDLFLYENLRMQGQFLGLEITEDVLPVDHYLNDGDEVTAASLKGKVIHTPGHTPGSLSFHFDQVEIGNQKHSLLFTGDTLFMSSIGRTDLWGGDYGQIIASITEKLVPLPEETIVISGHGPQTTIGREKKFNLFLQG